MINDSTIYYDYLSCLFQQLNGIEYLVVLQNDQSDDTVLKQLTIKIQCETFNYNFSENQESVN